MFRWIQNHPKILNGAYKGTSSSLRAVAPLLRAIGFKRVDGLFAFGERLTKRPLFDCRMCGQCILHSSGMTCPMSCPKTLRNGPCGGVRANGNCEVKPDMHCVWVQAWWRSDKLGGTSGQEIHMLQPPVDRSMQGSSAWINLLDGNDHPVPAGWVAVEEVVNA